MEENFLNRMMKLGYDYGILKDIIEDKGIPENDIDFACQILE
jgi:hypothetical protein